MSRRTPWRATDRNRDSRADAPHAPLLLALSRPPRGARLRSEMDHGRRGPAVPIYNASFAVPHVDVLAGDTVTWHNDSRPHPQRQRRRRQLRLPAAADVAARSSTASTRPGPSPTTASCTRRCAATSPSTASCSTPRRSRPPPGKPYALSGRAALPEGARSRSRPTAPSPRPPRSPRTATFTATVTPRDDDDLHRGRRRRVRAARPGARARPQGQRDAGGRGAKLHDRRDGHAGVQGRDRRAPAQAQGALRLVAGQGRQARRVLDACASRSRAAARSRRACC